VIAVIRGRFATVTEVAVDITLHETYPSTTSLAGPDFNPAQLIHPVTTLVFINNGVYPFKQVYPVKRLLFASTNP